MVVVLILFLPALQVAYTLTVVIHELAHVLAACCLGLRVHAIRFGSGAPLKTWRCCGVDIHLCGYPALGWTEMYPPKPAGYRWRTAAICLAGPLTNALLVAGFIPVFEATKTNGFPIDNALLFTSSLMIIVNFVMFFLSLTPYSIQIGKVRFYSDGLQLIKAVKLSDGPIAMLPQIGKAVQAARLGENDIKVSARWLRRQLRPEWSENAVFDAMRNLVFMEMIAQAINLQSIVLKLGADRSLAPDQRCNLVHGIAMGVLRSPNRQFVDECLPVLDGLIADFPDRVTLRGTRGGLYFESENYDAAERDLIVCFKQGSNRYDRGIAAAYLAQLARSRGDSKNAAAFETVARSAAPKHAIVNRLLKKAQEPTAAAIATS